MILSIVISSHSESELDATIASIRATAGDAVEIIVVDDLSHRPVVTDKAKVIRTQKRIGVGPARTLGVLHATGDYILLVDAHMRFVPGWYENAVARIVGRKKTLHCGVCLALDSDNMNPMNPSGRYFGATFNVYGPDPNAKNKPPQVMEVNWLRTEQADDSEIPCVCGACYFWPREWFLELNPLAHLHSWGKDEEIMSIKAWLAGGDVRLMKTVQIGHKFRQTKERIPFQLRGSDTLYNTLFLLHTCLPPNAAMLLQQKLKKGGELMAALRSLHDNWGLVEVERARNSKLFTRDFTWLLNRFGISFPSK